MHTNKIAFIKTIDRVASELDLPVKLLWEIIDGMEPEDGLIWVCGTDEDGVPAFSEFGIESLIELIEIHRGNNQPNP